MGSHAMESGRLIRVTRDRGDHPSVAYIVALQEAAEAIELIRKTVADAGDEIEDLGQVSDALLLTLDLQHGEIKVLERPPVAREDTSNPPRPASVSLSLVDSALRKVGDRRRTFLRMFRDNL